jgi:hypothetical protein
MTIILAPLSVESTVVAAIITVGGSGMLAGAVYFPVVSMVPQLAPEQPGPETLQTTLWLAGGLPTGPDTFALNCSTAPIGTVTLGDVTVTLSRPVETAVEGAVEEEHATRQRPRTNAVQSRIMILDTKIDSARPL